LIVHAIIIVGRFDVKQREPGGDMSMIENRAQQPSR
jgi:hypothetical protein